jgi:hypothetical protein
MKRYLFISAFIISMFCANSYVWAADSCCVKKVCACTKAGCCADGKCACKGACCTKDNCKCADGTCSTKCGCQGNVNRGGDRG